jgi:hypothetical protein
MVVNIKVMTFVKLLDELGGYIISGIIKDGDCSILYFVGQCKTENQHHHYRQTNQNHETAAVTQHVPEFFSDEGKEDGQFLILNFRFLIFNSSSFTCRRYNNIDYPCLKAERAN